MEKEIELITTGFYIHPEKSKDVPMFSHCIGGGSIVKEAFFKEKCANILRAHGFNNINIDGEIYDGD